MMTDERPDYMFFTIYIVPHPCYPHATRPLTDRESRFDNVPSREQANEPSLFVDDGKSADLFGQEDAAATAIVY